MSDPDREVMGESPGEIVLRRSRTDARLRLSPRAMERLAADASGPDPESSGAARVYLVLEDVRGTQDATVLSVHLRLPEGAVSGDCPEFLAGTVGLYGLRRASSSGEGLRFTLDVTPWFQARCRAMSAAQSEVLVSIGLQRELSAAAEIVIGRVVLVRQ